METVPPETPQDAKRQRILENALEVVLRYGYQRMTMDDIAKACGMSRPALYLHFRNKTDIYRAIAAMMMEGAISGMEAALSGPEPLDTRMQAALKSGVLDPVDQLMATAHGSEIIDMKDDLAGDVIANWHKRKVSLIAGAIAASGQGERKQLSPDLLANVLVDGIEGLLLRQTTADERQAEVDALIRLVCG